MDFPLIDHVRQGLQERANPEKAPQMQAYMKSEMLYLGVSSPERKALVKEALATYPITSADQFQQIVMTFWREATYREERYVAMDIADHRRHRVYQTLDMLPLYEEMIVVGAWWDYVDMIASHFIGGLLKRYPDVLKPEMRAWAQDTHLWKRRTAILCQLTFKDETDLALLYDCMEPALEEKEFFLRKAIGWALRQYARTDPQEVIRYVHEHADRLSGLSKREALKHLFKQGLVMASP